MDILAATHLVFYRPAGGRLKIADFALKQMLSYRQIKVTNKEAGGVLLGRLLIDSQDIVIDEVTEPMQGDKRSRFAFYRAKRRHQHIINQRWQESNGTTIYLGEWHTHPERIPTPSMIDMTDWRRKLTVDRFENDLFFLILGTVEAKMWTGSKRCGLLEQLNNMSSISPD